MGATQGRRRLDVFIGRFSLRFLHLRMVRSHGYLCNDDILTMAESSAPLFTCGLMRSTRSNNGSKNSELSWLGKDEGMGYCL